MSNKKYYWLKLKENFFDEDTIAWVEEQENGKEYCLFYLKLCLKSLKTNGLLIRNVGSMLVPYDAKQLSKVTNTEVDTVVVAMELFKRIGLVQILENGEIYIAQLQNMVGSETSKAQLMRNKREKDKKKEDRLECGNNVTKLLPISYSDEENCDTEVDIEKELENRERDKRKEIDIKKEEDIMYVDSSENLKKFSRLYEQNIGLINGVSAEWIKEMSERTDYKLFKRAIEIATDRNRCRLDYVKGILKQWTDKNIIKLEQLEAYQLQNKNQKGVKSDVRGRERNVETESPKYDRTSEEARRNELLEACRRAAREE
ncbi:phage replisome organizer N-terminal domain-containing protein [Clostridium sp. CCUG 7971]|uniref:phage replisome organizer N-terminal domain-containing protein n=1 Tax=Clostridium sp. CCUG 7971 TaxID=2811414 RepID=UPI001ABB7EE1|nr:phage replisome organizer N-terminal domain-containing protein [Clostridium sp. CCUG 7971]MBO3444838.1 phage replisome organizer N-terminal domain-containing protein [Clostridium sp. CCUG 7971]